MNSNLKQKILSFKSDRKFVLKENKKIFFFQTVSMSIYRLSFHRNLNNKSLEISRKVSNFSTVLIQISFHNVKPNDGWVCGLVDRQTGLLEICL